MTAFIVLLVLLLVCVGVVRDRLDAIPPGRRLGYILVLLVLFALALVSQ